VGMVNKVECVADSRRAKNKGRLSRRLRIPTLP